MTDIRFETFMIHGPDPKGETHMSHDVPTLEELKGSLFGYISDAHKDAYGFRPRGHNWREMSVAELEAWADELSNAVVSAIEEEARWEAEARADWEAAVAKMIELGAADRETAVRWLFDAEGLLNEEHSEGYANYKLGVGYDYNLATGEVGYA